MTAIYPQLDSLIVYPPWANQIAEASTWGERYMVDAGVSGVVVDSAQYAQTLPLTTARQGVIAHSFFEDFYFRIHIIPGSLSLGNLASEQSQEIYFWNAFFHTKTLIDVVGTNSEGLEIVTPELPFEMRALHDEVFTLLAGVEGPPSIDASFSFIFSDDGYDFGITGSRSVTLAFPPVRDTSYDEEFYWPSTVFTAEDGTEQVMSLSDDPKITVNFNAYVFNEERWLLESKIWGWQGREYAVPVWKSSTALTERIIPGGQTLAVKSTEYREFSVGGLAFLYLSPEINETVEIGSITANSISLVRPVGLEWPAGAAVMPVRQMRIPNELTYTGEVANAREFVFTLKSDSAETQASYPWPWTYEGLPVLEFSPDMKIGLSGSFNRDITPVETNYGKPFLYDRMEATWHKHGWLFTFETRAESYRFLSLLTQLRGACGYFWAATWSPDMEVVETIAANSNVLIVKAYGMSGMYTDLRGRRGIRIELKNGTVIHRRIVEISRGAAAGTEAVTLNSNIPQQIPASAVRYVSFMTISRFAQDKFKFKWETLEWSEVQVTIKDVPNAV